MAVNTDRDQLKEQEENYRQSLGPDDVERGTQAAENYANSGQGQDRQNYYRSNKQDGQAKESAGDKKGGGAAGAVAGAVSTAAGATPVGRVAKVLGVLSRNKKKAGGGILGTLIVVAILIGGVAFKGFEIIHMMDRFETHNFGVTTRSEFRLAARALRSTFQKGQDVANRGDARRDGNTRRTGRMIRDYLNDSRLDKLDQRLKQRGYEFVYDGDAIDIPNGKRVATGVRRPDGSVIEPGSYGQANLEIRNLVDQDIPAWRVGKRFRYYQLARYRTGWTRKFFVGQKLHKPGDAFNRLRERVRSSGTADTNRRIDEDDDPDRDPTEQARANEGIGDLNEGIDAAKSGKRFKVDPGKFLKTTGFIALACLINDLDNNAKEVDKLKYLAPLILGQQSSTMADQMKVGGTATVASEEVDEIGTDALNKQPVYATETTLDEDGNVIAEKGEVVEEGEYWDTSAAWQRAIGVTVDGEELAAEARFDDQAGNALVRGIIGGLNTVSPAPIISNFGACPGQNGFFDAIYAGIDLISGPIGFIAGEAISRIPFVQEQIERAIKFVAGVAICADVVGTSPRQTANCIDLGLQLSNVEHVRGNLAGPPIPESKQVEYMQKVALERGEYVRSRGFAYRYFNPENPDSLLSRTAIAMPNDWGEAGQSLMNLPSTAIASVGNLLSGRVFAQTPEQEFDGYGLRQFGVTDEEINDPRWENPEENEDRVTFYLRYYCWEENGQTYHTPDGEVEEGCDRGRVGVAMNMREYLYCQQLPYVKIGTGPEGKLEDNGYKDHKCDEKYHRDVPELDILPDTPSWLDYENLMRTTLWMSDRYTVENLSQLVADMNLDPEITFKLLVVIQECSERNGEEPPAEIGDQDPGPNCYALTTEENSIFYSKEYITGAVSENIGTGAEPPATDPGGGPGGGGTGPVASGTAQELAQRIIASPNVAGDSRYMGQIEAVAAGDNSCNLDVEVLRMIATMMQNYSFYITSINRFCTGVLTASGTRSAHYRDGGGRAVDFGSINGIDIIGSGGRAITKQFAEEAATIIPSGSGIGQINCGMNLSLPSGIRHFNDTCNHLHIEVP